MSSLGEEGALKEDEVGELFVSRHEFVSIDTVGDALFLIFLLSSTDRGFDCSTGYNLCYAELVYHTPRSES